MTKPETGPHLLMQFGLNGSFTNETYAAAIWDFIVDLECADTETIKHNAANWFLLESEKAFFSICNGAGINGERLREHLRAMPCRTQ
jgi:hypothetical protein